mmetsp:Transcript_18077/g.39063  ORF Transcript_18077/g.39063 Transcript_18077/m.39063 type:complete len:322 (+) Transcript_18077:220-1185(+)|eukprot:CAMPEP_0172328972 /NCGR_PEP_ID=MMETSP1058-20130122/60634_1 /TAXON_ID=83371 /ORGANISM="Detonula confervacea, Strain CCMP 353" /LENGTH=321 /DNA_ID=CAMNT_0013046117 /DNA_START=103 /DNA_END=1068 /DNA_ORIENTATION=+
MRLLSLCLLITSVLAAPASGEEACDASAADASGGNACTPKYDDSHDVDVMDDDDDEEEAAERPIWWDYDIDQIFTDYFDCGSIIYGYESDSDDDPVAKDYPRNDDVASDVQVQKLRQQWALMREKYVKEVNLVPIEIHYAEGDDTELDEEMHLSNRGVSSLVVPSRVGDAGPEKGRGVFATEPIPKGTLVVSMDNGSTAIFKEGHSWREFAVSLPREPACNFIEWSWVQTIPPRNEIDDDIRNGLTISVTFDESNLMNAADWDDVEANVSCGRPPMREGDEQGLCRFHYYAARDIAAGEELLVNYGDFEDLSQQGWVDIGL